jgi:hypothetical protein
MSTIETMRFICGGCGYRARIPSSYTGKVILCPGCQQMQIASPDGGESTGDTVRMSKVTTAQGTAKFSATDADGRLRFTCTGCGFSAKLASSYAGKAISCPQCKSPQLIPPLGPPEGDLGKPLPPSAPVPAAADQRSVEPAAPEGGAAAAVDPGKGIAFAITPPAPGARPAPEPDGTDDISFELEPAPEPVPPKAAPGRSAAGSRHSPPKPPGPTPAAAGPATKPGSGGVVRRGSRMALPAAAPEEHQEEEADMDQAPAKPLPPWVQRLKQPRMMAIVGGIVAVVILQIVLVVGWLNASTAATEERTRAEAAERQSAVLGDEKKDIGWKLDKASADILVSRKAEGEAKAALAAAETRALELGEKLKQAESDKQEEYDRRKKAEAAYDEVFAKAKKLEGERDEDYRVRNELRKKYEEEVKLRKELKTRLDEAQAAAKK